MVTLYKTSWNDKYGPGPCYVTFSTEGRILILLCNSHNNHKLLHLYHEKQLFEPLRQNYPWSQSLAKQTGGLLIKNQGLFKLKTTNFQDLSKARHSSMNGLSKLREIKMTDRGLRLCSAWRFRLKILITAPVTILQASLYSLVIRNSGIQYKYCKRISI